MKTWSQTSGNLASTDANWVGGVAPIADDDVIFDGTSTANCTWDLVITLGSFSMIIGYSGTATVAAATDWGTTGNILIQAGTFTPVTTSIVTCAGNFTISDGTLTADVLKLMMTKDGAAINLSKDASFGVYELTANNNCTLTNAGYRYLGISNKFTVTANKTFTIVTATGSIQIKDSAIPGSLLAGTIAGPGKLIFSTDTSKTLPSFANVTINSPLEFYNWNIAARTFTLLEDTYIKGTGAVEVTGVTGACIIHHGTNYCLAFQGPVTMNAFSTLTQGIGTWTFSSTYTQSGASSVFTQGGYCRIAGAASISNGTWSVNAVARVASLSQSGGTITVASGFTLFYDSTVSLTGGSATGAIVRFPYASEKGDDAVAFEMPKAGARF